MARPAVEQLEDRCLLSYAVTDLGTLGEPSAPVNAVSDAVAINASGQVAGSSQFSSSYAFHAFLYGNGHMTNLGTLGGPQSYANGLNDAGQVVGDSDIAPIGFETFRHAFLYSNGHMTDLGTLGGNISNFSSASGINASGQVVGWSQLDDGSTEHAFLYSNGDMADLGTLGGQESEASGINSSGQVVGTSEVFANSNVFHAFLYGNGHMTDLGTLGGPNSGAYAINASGQVIGESDIADSGVRHTFLYSGGRMTDFTALAGFSAMTINDSGEVFGSKQLADGTHFFIYSDGTTTDLGVFPDPGLGVVPGSGSTRLTGLAGIDAAGQIAGQIENDQHQHHAALLSPVTRFGFGAPDRAFAGIGFSVTVTALDPQNQPTHGYGVTVHFTSSDGQATLPADYTFRPADNGVHTFTVTLQTLGSQTITVTDATGAPTATTSLTVQAPPPPAASFDWRMLPHFGVDALTASYDPGSGQTTFAPGSDGLIDYPWEDANDFFDHYGSAYLNPKSWLVDLDASASQGTVPITSYQFTVQGVSAPPQGNPQFRYAFPALGKYSVTLTVTDAKGQTSIVTQDVVLKDYLIVSIGDSFASGEGAPDQPLVLDDTGLSTKKGAVWEDQRTHRSANAAPAQAALAIQAANPHASVTFVSVAASGSGITEGLIGPYDGIEPPTIYKAWLGPQITQIQQLVGDRPIDALLISSGGNDAGFANIIAQLVPPDPFFSQKDAIAAQFRSSLSSLPALYDELNGRIHSTYQLPVENIYITEYADPTHDADGGYSDFPGLLGGLFHIPGIDAEKAQWAYDNVLVPLNSVVQQAARRNGWDYVGGIDARFATHGIPAGDQRWFNTLEDSQRLEGPLPGLPTDTKGPVHPNVQGWQVIGEQITQQILTGSIQGHVFEDLAGRATDNPAALPGLALWTVYLDTNGNGLLDPGEPSTVTAGNGDFSFTGLPHGTYIVTEVPPAGWLARHLSVTVKVFSDALAGPQEADFGNYHPGTLSGTVFLDANRNGARDGGEPGLTGRTVFLDLNGNGTLDAPQTANNVANLGASLRGLILATLDFHGLTGLLTGVSVSLNITPQAVQTLGVALVSPAGKKVVLSPNDGQFSATIPLSDFNGEDPNGTWTLTSATISLFPAGLTSGLTLTIGEPSTTTDHSGAYAFAGLAPGDYAVDEVRLAGSVATTPATGVQHVNLQSGASLPTIDFGDAAANAATLNDSADGQQVTLASPTGTTLMDARSVPNPSPSDAPGGVQFPVGFFAFQVQGLAVGASTTVTLGLPSNVTVSTYYRYSPTPDNHQSHWYPFLFDGNTGAEIDNVNHRITLHFVDGQRGDDDLSANGVVVDAGGPAENAGNAAGENSPGLNRALRWASRVSWQLLGQSAPAQVKAMAQRLEQGTSPRQLVLKILNSRAYRVRRIGTLYHDLLHRPPDHRALTASLRFLAKGGTIESLRDGLLASDDYFQMRGQGTGTGFLLALWRDVLASPAPPLARAVWKGPWARMVVVRQAMVARLTHNPAAYRKVVHHLFAQAGRPVDRGRLAVYAGWLRHGAGEGVVLTDILGSASYFASV